MITYKELSSLTFDLGFSAKALYTLSNNISHHYYQTKIPKGNGETRTLSVPDNFLKTVQKRIVETLLVHQEVSPYAAAYRYGTSVVRNARPHLKSDIVLKLDIKHFFDSILYPTVKEKAFPNEKYSEKNRILLTLLCIYKDSLPQGAPSSPIISNIIMKDFDNFAGNWCRERNIRYTRYCDDMTFSGDFDPSPVVALVREELKKMGFYLNDKKTVILHNGQRKTVTGIVVNEKLNTPLSYRKKLRQELYYCKKYGLRSHLERKNIDINEKNYLEKLLGKVNYTLSVDAKNKEMQQYKAWLIQELHKNNIQNDSRHLDGGVHKKSK